MARHSRSARYREWALANGYEIPARGRISSNVEESFDAAHCYWKPNAGRDMQEHLLADRRVC
ncbi:Lsr2 family DNA-binding protein [Rhodococcus opacus]|uniref:Lsr2 family DNA-binding protein n=1 Tax=Rhodococcus opacus TaxID=37919 RepID=UPI00358E7B3B